MTHRSASRVSLSPRGPLLFLCLLACSAGNAAIVFAAGEIRGSVRNQTLNRPAANDDVILLRFDSGTPEESRTKTDAQGAFSIATKDPSKPYLLRVMHQGVAYDQRAVAGDTLSVEVFESSARVPAVAGTIEILRAGTTGSLLHVSDMYELRNDSDPPITQASERTFDVYIPAGAKLSSVFAAGPGKIGESISAFPVSGEPGHFAVAFPLRPGATKFAFNYDLPYAGHARFRTNRAYSVQQLAVMLPPSMKFSSQSDAFVPLRADNLKYQVMAANQLPSGKGPAFELSGSGALPPLGDQASSRPASQPQSPAYYHPNIASTAPTSASQTPAASFPALAAKTNGVALSQPTTPSSQSFVLGGLSGILLATCVFLVWHTRKSRAP